MMKRILHRTKFVTMMMMMMMMMLLKENQKRSLKRILSKTPNKVSTSEFSSSSSS